VNREAGATIEGDVLFAVRLQIAWHTVAVDGLEPVVEQAPTNSQTLPRGIHPEKRQIPVRLRGVEPLERGIDLAPASGDSESLTQDRAEMSEQWQRREGKSTRWDGQQDPCGVTLLAR
jgi:hypothetical protein